jgi:hypothetical protein
MSKNIPLKIRQFVWALPTLGVYGFVISQFAWGGALRPDLSTYVKSHPVY